MLVRLPVCPFSNWVVWGSAEHAELDAGEDYVLQEFAGGSKGGSQPCADNVYDHAEPSQA